MVFEVKFPILGFDSVKRVKLTKIDDLFMKLENSDDATPSFTLVNPFMLRDYSIDIPPYLKSLLEITDKSNILIVNVMIVSTPIENSTVNFIAPLVFNFDNNNMAQLVLDSNRYPHLGLSESISKYIKNSESK